MLRLRENVLARSGILRRSLRSNFLCLPLISACVLLSGASQNGESSAAHGDDLRFEVATIKPHDPGSGKLIGVRLYPGGKVEIVGVPLKQLICIALHAGWWQVNGGDTSTEKLTYDVEALPPESMRSSITNPRYTLYGIEDERLRTMLTALLEDRFKLKFSSRSEARNCLPLAANERRLPSVSFGQSGTRRRWKDH